MTLDAGTKLGPYEILSPLGAGGMGEVYRAKDPRLGRDVAVKVLPEEFFEGEERRQRFEREARLLAALNHPGIAAIYSFEEISSSSSSSSSTRHILVMELVEGDGLDARIASGPLSLEEFLSLAIQMAEAIAAAHEKGIVHRDLKPANVKVSPVGRIKLLDFGLAKRSDATPAGSEDETSTGGLTQQGLVMGTMPYMSPEQVEGREVDHRTDIFSLGVVLHEMATGTRPFRGGSTAALLSAILRDPPPPIIDVRSDLPGEVGRLIGRCLEKDRERRMQTAKDVRNELETLRRSVDSGGALPRSSARPAERPSIVVLPFANLSPDADNEYFSDGLTEEIIADLSRVRALRVISRTSAMQLKSAKKDVKTIGRELNVRYVLEGGVRKAGNSLRITAQLIDALTDAHLWSEKYSGTVDDVFEVQERVSREIVKALDVTLTSDDDRRLAERPIASARAFELYLQARQEVRRMGGDALSRAAALLAQAVAIEGETPRLLALMAWTRVTHFRIGIDRSPKRLDEAEAQARALLERAPESPDGHALLGYVAYERGHLPQAVGHFRRALDREPNDADVLFYMGIAYIAAGQNDSARATAKRMIAYDPLSPLSWMLSGACGWFVGRFDESLPDVVKAVELDPQGFVLHWTAGYACAALGRLSEAARHAAFMRENGPDVPYTRQLLALLEGLEGRPEAARELLAAVDVAPLDAHNKFHLAESFGLAGETDRALDVLEQAVEQGFYPYQFIATHCPFLSPLRNLPRFAAILAKAKERVESFRD